VTPSAEPRPRAPHVSLLLLADLADEAGRPSSPARAARWGRRAAARGWHDYDRGMIGFLVAGLVIGALARLIKPGKQSLGILATLGLGLVGSLIGGLIAQAFGTGSIWELNILGFVLAVVAAVLLIGVAEQVAGKKSAV
jgi:uncharacterized membrane protein YeaQ/YmgE (transglycosylase-associated protein family)